MLALYNDQGSSGLLEILVCGEMDTWVGTMMGTPEQSCDGGC